MYAITIGLHGHTPGIPVTTHVGSIESHYFLLGGRRFNFLGHRNVRQRLTDHFRYETDFANLYAKKQKIYCYRGL